ncbi:uncharacterized protein B0I36DRAFT_357131 [Microdochium trichocladiopsis]|uniref:Uncharacterized protein n=1 Tax=Microdochium trichocladiopsis TaxID=1682393 RepID=A0A9P8YI78_9PEZI|nr:uncharacterized protein B0I36DRAFT_357131 [Microdochium trichocladiopsis]KAH7039736.1 hypothetical protein B0I36DRAFT_357131 [Microdochium trichocladiopsis]
MKTSSIFAAAAVMLAGSAVAAPLERRAELVAADIVAQIAPKSVSCAAGSDECRTNKQVGEALVEAMLAYEIYNPAAMASITALIALESGEFVYKRNLQHDGADSIHWGQGTSNMQTFKYQLLFANSFPEVASQVAALGAVDGNKAAMNKVLDLVVDDKYNFKSGPWFYATQCGADVHSAFEGSDLDKAFELHMACVLGSGSIAPERTAYWNTAKKAFGLA